MKKKQKRRLYYCLALALLALAGYHGYQKNGFYKSAYNDELPTEQNSTNEQNESREGKEYQSTGDLSLLDVKLPDNLENQTVRYKAITVYFNKDYRVPNCVAYELTSTTTSRDVPTGGNTRKVATHAGTWLRQWICAGTRQPWKNAST